MILGRYALNLVVPHGLVHVFPAGNYRSTGQFFVQGIAFLNTAQTMPTGATNGFGISLPLAQLGIG